MSTGRTKRVELRAHPQDLRRWRVTAAIDGFTLTEWITRQLNDRALNGGELEYVEDQMVAREKALVAAEGRQKR